MNGHKVLDLLSGKKPYVVSLNFDLLTQEMLSHLDMANLPLSLKGLGKIAPSYSEKIISFMVTLTFDPNISWAIYSILEVWWLLMQKKF